jgi:Cysteine rich repeat
MNTTFKLRRNNIAITATVAFAAIMAGCIDARAQAQPSPEVASQARALALTCRADFTRFCSSVRPGGGRGLACLQQHLSELTPECRSAIPKAEALRSKAAETGAPPR